MLRGEVQSTLTLNDWARYIDKMNRQDLTRLITAIIWWSIFQID